MNYISFYRKWRPQSFNQIIGQDYNIKTIQNALSKKKLSHSYLLCGPRGTGKTSTARILAKALNCKDGITPDPCNKCENCLSISNGSSVDVTEIDTASNRGINEIRELKEKVRYLPSTLRKKVYIIDEVHMLTIEAFNALLKVLEEPPEHITFIMATTEPNKVISTIISRCQRFDFFPISLDKTKQRIKEIAKNENIKISDQALSLVAKHADGSLRDADGILEQLAAYGDDSIDTGDVVSLLGVVDLELLFELVEILAEKNINNGLLFINKVINSNQSLKVFTSEFLDHLYNLYIIKNYNNPSEIMDISQDYDKRYKAQSEIITKEELEFYIDMFADLYKQIKWGEGSRVFFIAAMIKAINFIVTSEKDLGKKTRVLEVQLKALNERFEKIRPYPPAEKNKVESAEGSKKILSKENEDVHLEVNGSSVAKAEPSNKTEPSKTVKPSDKVESTSIDPISESPAIIKSGGIEPNNIDPNDNNITVITDKLDEILKTLKKKKISAYAMFVESEPSRIEEGILYFILSEDKIWHKDHLNKEKNVKLIAGIIKEVTGIKYKIKFELGRIALDKSKKDKDNKQAVHVKENPDPPKDIEDMQDRAPDKQEDVFKYFEKKFKIKE